MCNQYTIGTQIVYFVFSWVILNYSIDVTQFSRYHEPKNTSYPMKPYQNATCICRNYLMNVRNLTTKPIIVSLYHVIQRHSQLKKKINLNLTYNASRHWYARRQSSQCFHKAVEVLHATGLDQTDLKQWTSLRCLFSPGINGPQSVAPRHRVAC